MKDQNRVLDDGCQWQQGKQLAKQTMKSRTPGGTILLRKLILKATTSRTVHRHAFMIATVDDHHCIVGILQHDRQEEHENFCGPITAIRLPLRTVLSSGSRKCYNASETPAMEQFCESCLLMFLIWSCAMFCTWMQKILRSSNIVCCMFPPRCYVTVDHIDISLVGHTKLRNSPQHISKLAVSVPKNHNPGASCLCFVVSTVVLCRTAPDSVYICHTFRYCVSI